MPKAGSTLHDLLKLVAEIELMKIKREDADQACASKYDVQKIIEEELLHRKSAQQQSIAL